MVGSHAVVSMWPGRLSQWRSGVSEMSKSETGEDILRSSLVAVYRARFEELTQLNADVGADVQIRGGAPVLSEECGYARLPSRALLPYSIRPRWGPLL